MHRTALAAALLLLICCGGPSPTMPPTSNPPVSDLTINLVLALQGDSCVVRFADVNFKSELRAIAFTGHALIWQVRQNGCGEKRRQTVKALGLRGLTLRATGQPAAWLEHCTTLDLVPATISTPPAFRCDIPSSATGSWEGIYDYEIDGDSIAPSDPGVDVRRNG